MTAESFIEQDGDSLGVDKIARSALAYALYNNPIAIAQRGTDAPWLNGVGAIEVLSTVGTSTWTVPDGVYRVKVTLIGAGGGGGSAYDTNDAHKGTAGGSTSFVSVTAGGGGGGWYNSTAPSTGSNTGGTISLYSKLTGTDNSPLFFGMASSSGGSCYGSGGSASSSYLGGSSGRSGNLVIDIINTTPGASISYTVGAGGAGGAHGGVSGTGGLIIIEY